MERASARRPLWARRSARAWARRSLFSASATASAIGRDLLHHPVDGFQDIVQALILFLQDAPHLRHPVRQVQDDFQQFPLGIFLQALLELHWLRNFSGSSTQARSRARTCGADLLLLRLGAGALVGELVIQDFHLHLVGLTIQHHAPEAVGQSVTVPDLMILDQGPRPGLAFRAADLVQGLGLQFFKTHIYVHHSNQFIFFKFNILPGHGNPLLQQSRDFRKIFYAEK